MYLKKSKLKNGRIYLSIADGYREDRNILNYYSKILGYLDELENNTVIQYPF